MRRQNDGRLSLRVGLSRRGDKPHMRGMRVSLREAARGFAYKTVVGSLTYTEPLRVRYDTDLERAALEQLLDAVAHAANAGIPPEVIKHACDVGAELQAYSKPEIIAGGRVFGAVLHSSAVVSYMGETAEGQLLVVRPGYDTAVVDPETFYAHYAEANGL